MIQKGREVNSRAEKLLFMIVNCGLIVIWHDIMEFELQKIKRLKCVRERKRGRMRKTKTETGDEAL